MKSSEQGLREDQQMQTGQMKDLVPESFPTAQTAAKMAAQLHDSVYGNLAARYVKDLVPESFPTAQTAAQMAAQLHDSVYGNSVARYAKGLVPEPFSRAQAAAKMTAHLHESVYGNSVARYVKDLVPEAFSTAQTAAQTAAHLHNSVYGNQERIRRMLDPIQDTYAGFRDANVISQLMGDVAKPLSASEYFSKITDHALGGFKSSVYSSFEDAAQSAQKMLLEASFGNGIGQLMKRFEDINKNWLVPQSLLDTLGPLHALQESVGRLHLPVMNAASAATLASVLGPEGIRAQLAALGINPDGSVDVQLVEQEDGIGLSRQTLELMALLSFILTFLVPIYQEISSSKWQAGVDGKLEAQSQKLENLLYERKEYQKTIESLAKLVEKAIAQEIKQEQERFVVLDRVAVVRSRPEHGSSVDGKLLPREVVRPISESGKWIEFEYYHWLYQEHRTGWALKKYFQRVPSNFESSN